jgi:CubicO group peptidase (beta-lactamase class C family)
VPPSIDKLVDTWQATIPNALRRHDVPGLAIGVCDRNGALWSAGFGTAARGGGGAITTATRFGVQSTSKLVTATTVLMAVQQGLLELDEPITRYLPDFTVNSVFDERPGDLITLRHLLSHTAGFTHEAPIGSNFDLGTGDFDEHCRSISRSWLRFPVGHHHEYSNLGIDLAAYALQHVTGISFDEYARRELFEPLGMARSTFDAVVIRADVDRAIGHWRPFDEAGRALPVEVPMVGAGGLYTSVDDALRFTRLHLRDGTPLLSSELIAEQYRVPFAEPDQRLGYGLGVYEWSPGVRVRHHGGSGFGFQAELCWIPELSIGATVLTNSFDHSLPAELAHEFVDHVAREAGATPATPPAAATPVAADRDALIAFAGEYIGRLGDRVELHLDGDHLLVHDSRTHLADLAHLIAPRTVEVADTDRTRYRLSEDRGGAPTYLRALRDGQVRYRNDATTTPASTLDPGLAGCYVAAAWGVQTDRFRLAQDGASPVLQDLAGDVALRLSPIGKGRYLSSTGEVLDVTGPTPTYANIALTRTPGAADSG